ncbi:polysaccharide pyruvyl transferase family protein [Enterococcus gallinarum]|uniref:polysaccharide pyruvyl transferase family protein n=1 Tax=Enterococcus gallinarum TaxID=1353 RepID=UPI0035C94ACB
MKILLSAYLDNNIGDDYMIELLANHFKQHQFYIFSTNSVLKESFKNVPNINFVNSNIYKANVNDFDGLIKIGGSMFIVNSIGHLKQRLQEIIFVKKFKLKRKFALVLGSNYGPFSSWFGKLLVKLELRTYDLLTVRDRESYQFLVNEKFDNNFYLFDDIVYNLEESKICKQKNDFKGSRDILGISAYHSKKTDINFNQYFFFAKTIDNYLQKENRFVYLFAFDSENENDLSACHHIKHLSKYPEKIAIIPYLGDREKFISEMEKCDIFIAIRFHAAILCDILKVPFVPVAYSNKMKNLMEDNYFRNFYELDELRENQDLISKLNMDLENKENLFYQNEKKERDARGHFEVVEHFLERQKNGTK